MAFYEKQDYNLVVPDANLPDGSGFDFCREMKECRSDTAVIFLMSRHMENDMLRGLSWGRTTMWQSPFQSGYYVKRWPPAGDSQYMI